MTTSLFHKSIFTLVIIAIVTAPVLADKPAITDPGPLDVTVTNFPSSIDVTVTNHPSQQAPCLCFTQADLDSALGTGPATQCRDDRYGTDAETVMWFGATDPKVSVIYISSDSEYRCFLVGGSNTPVVGYYNIGFTNAMACRALIINSPQWTTSTNVTCNP